MNLEIIMSESNLPIEGETRTVVRTGAECTAQQISAWVCEFTDRHSDIPANRTYNSCDLSTICSSTQL